MQNKKPEFTDRELEIIERLLSHYYDEDGICMKHDIDSTEIGRIVSKSNYYRLGVRNCKNGCHMDKKVELFVWDQPEYCVLCAPWYKDQDLVFTDKDTIYCKKCGETYTSIEEEFFYQTCQLFTCRKCGAKYVSKEEQERLKRKELEEKTKAARVEPTF